VKEKLVSPRTFKTKKEKKKKRVGRQEKIMEKEKKKKNFALSPSRVTDYEKP
jgi:hypothetical protein